jgi:hypothetical protein
VGVTIAPAIGRFPVGQPSDPGSPLQKPPTAWALPVAVWPQKDDSMAAISPLEVVLGVGVCGEEEVAELPDGPAELRTELGGT